MLNLLDELSNLMAKAENGGTAVTREKYRCKAIIKCEELLRELKKEGGDEGHSAEIAKLRGLLMEAAQDIKERVDAEYPNKEDYPIMQRRHARDMNIVTRITAALGQKGE